MCGIVAYSGKGVIDPLKFKHLLLYNRERGVHATGICIDHEVTKEAIPPHEFLGKYILNFSNKKTNTVLGHARQASFSMDSKKDEWAHPFKISDGLDTSEYPVDYEIEGEGDLILVMNGTINNMHSLCSFAEIKGYSYDISDTLYLSKIIGILGDKFEDILSKYTGAATLAFMRPQANERDHLYVWKDSARPLFYTVHDEGMYISSMRESLFSIGSKYQDIHSFIDDNLYYIVAGEIKEKKHITHKPIVYGYTNMAVEKTWGRLGDKFPNDSYIHLEDRELLYYYKQKPADGLLFISKEGKVHENAEKDSGEYNGYHFCCGYMMNSSKAYDQLQKLLLNEELGIIDESFKAFNDLGASKISSLVATPVRSLLSSGFYYYKDATASGLMTVPFSPWTYNFFGGNLTYINMKGDKDPKELSDVELAKVVRKTVDEQLPGSFAQMANWISSDLSIQPEFNFRMRTARALVDIVVEDCGLDATTASSYKSLFEKERFSNRMHRVLDALVQSCSKKETFTNPDIVEDDVKVNMLEGNLEFIDNVTQGKFKYGQLINIWVKKAEANSYEQAIRVHRAVLTVIYSRTSMSTELFQKINKISDKDFPKAVKEVYDIFKMDETMFKDDNKVVSAYIDKQISFHEPGGIGY